ncbi:unnamed protein product [Fusarium venenatum]|uniref:Uncharacterized protein n=1 Tax=Fusarium venenatum TaxID=56646 RepID=A0A2L2TNJ0_9HYPO|nr:uncharacterized protein FVRRES_03793 [Fusarium venenatum]CEI67281.1 unnamed protein product [Fusarium venenatum]
MSFIPYMRHPKKQEAEMAASPLAFARLVCMSIADKTCYLTSTGYFRAAEDHQLINVSAVGS